MAAICCFAAADLTITPEDLMLRPRADAAPRLEEMMLEQAERYLIERASSNSSAWSKASAA